MIDQEKAARHDRLREVARAAARRFVTEHRGQPRTPESDADMIVSVVLAIVDGLAEMPQTTCFYVCSVCRGAVDPPRQLDGER